MDTTNRLFRGYTIKKVFGRGNGLIATKNYSPGDLIVREYPIIHMPNTIFSCDDPDYIEGWLDKKINRLTSEDRFKFYNLSDSRGNECDVNCKLSNKTTLGIFYTNCMNFINDSAAIFPTLARSNHSCMPNSEFITRKKVGVQDLVAIRPIYQGEEITLSYISASDEGADERKVRVDYLLQYYGFMCNCEICSLQGAALKSNDALRRKIKGLQSKGLSKLTLFEINELVDGLRVIESKLVYQKEVLDQAVQVALKENNLQLLVKFHVSSLITDSIIEDSPSIENDYKLIHGLKLQNVQIRDSNYVFHLNS